jgi:hypothetical protein
MMASKRSKETLASVSSVEMMGIKRHGIRRTLKRAKEEKTRGASKVPPVTTRTMKVTMDAKAGRI